MSTVSEVNAESSLEPLKERASARFSEMLISPYIKERLAASKFTTPTPVQAATIPQALEGKDVLATAQTGTGKTLAFLIPVIEKLLKDKTPGIAALVLVPTRELAMQVVEQFNALRGKQLLPAALVVGGLSEGAQLQAIRKGARLVVATPGRLEDYLDRRLFHFNALRILILDEADRMLDMGFLPAIRRIVSILPKERQTMCFSATMEGDMVRIVKDYLRNAVRLSFGSTSKPSENVRVQAFEVAMDRKQEMLQRLLTKETGKCLVFARTKRGTERIAESLNRKGFSAAMIHGDRSFAGSGGKLHPSRRAHRPQRRPWCGFDPLCKGAAIGTLPTRAFVGHQDRAVASGRDRFPSRSTGAQASPSATHGFRATNREIRASRRSLSISDGELSSA